MSYPLSLPASPKPREMRFYPRFAVGESESIYTYQGEFFEHLGQQMRVDVSLPPMKRAEAEEWITWSLRLNGVLGTFLMGPAHPNRGPGTGTPLVDGAGQQRSKTLNTKGWAATTEVLKAGDHFQIGAAGDAVLYMSLTDVTSDGAGEAGIAVFPRIRTALTNNAAITVSSPVGNWRLIQPVVWDARLGEMYGFTFSAREAL